MVRRNDASPGRIPILKYQSNYALYNILTCEQLIDEFMSQHEAMLSGFNENVEIQMYWKACEDVCLRQSEPHCFQDLMGQLITLYSRIFEYQARVINHLSKKPRSRAVDETIGWHDWNTLAKSIADRSSEMKEFSGDLVDKDIIYRNWQKQLEKMDQSNEFLEGILRLAAEYVNLQEASIVLQKESVDLQKTEPEIELLKTLSSKPYDKALNHVRERVQGTCGWFFKNPDFLKWRDAKTSSILWVSALPGCGKSVLAKSLIMESHLTTNPLTTNIAHFFFQDGTGQTTKTGAMCALLWQLLINDPTKKLTGHACSLRNARGNQSLADDFWELWKLLEYCASSSACGDIIFVIDALDECSKSDRGDFIKALKTFASSTKATDGSINLKVLITSRPYNEFELDLKSNKLFKHIPFDQISKEEIWYVVKARMSDFNGRLTPNACEKISNYLINVEAHTYLGLDLILQYIHEKYDRFGTRDDVDEQLRKLPTTTFGLYKELLEIDQDEYTKPRSSLLLQIVYGAGYPLTLEEANYALQLALKLNRKQKPRLFDSHESLKSMLCHKDQFQSYVRKWTGFMVDVYDGKLIFIHQTVREFLDPSSQCEGEQCQEREDSNKQWYHTSRKDAHLLMFEICWQYLSIGGFASGNRIICHGGDVSSWKEEVDKFSTDYPLLRYASAEWPNHAISSDPDSFLSLEAVDLEKAPAFRDAWLLRAAENGKNQTVAQLLGAGADVNAKSEYSWTALVFAAENGHEAVVKQLLEAGADVNAKDWLD